VRKPRAIGDEGEVHLSSFEKLRNPSEFGQQVMNAALSGMAIGRYADVVTGCAESFGLSKSSLSRHMVTATAEQLRERDLSEVKPFVISLMVSGEAAPCSWLP